MCDVVEKWTIGDGWDSCVICSIVLCFSLCYLSHNSWLCFGVSPSVLGLVVFLLGHVVVDRLCFCVLPSWHFCKNSWWYLFWYMIIMDIPGYVYPPFYQCGFAIFSDFIRESFIDMAVRQLQPTSFNLSTILSERKCLFVCFYVSVSKTFTPTTPLRFYQWESGAGLYFSPIYWCGSAIHRLSVRTSRELRDSMLGGTPLRRDQEGGPLGRVVQYGVVMLP